MVAKLSEADRRPLASPPLGVALSSGTAPGPIIQKLIVNCTVTGALTLTMVDGSTVLLGTLPVGVYVFDVQCQSVAWTGTMVVGGFWHAS